MQITALVEDGVGDPSSLQAVLLFHVCHPISFTLGEGALQRKQNVPAKSSVFPYLLSKNKQIGKAIPEFNLLQFISGAPASPVSYFPHIPIEGME